MMGDIARRLPIRSPTGTVSIPTMGTAPIVPAEATPIASPELPLRGNVLNVVLPVKRKPRQSAGASPINVRCRSTPAHSSSAAAGDHVSVRDGTLCATLFSAADAADGIRGAAPSDA